MSHHVQTHMVNCRKKSFTWVKMFCIRKFDFSKRNQKFVIHTTEVVFCVGATLKGWQQRNKNTQFSYNKYDQCFCHRNHDVIFMTHRFYDFLTIAVASRTRPAANRSLLSFRSAGAGRARAPRVICCCPRAPEFKFQQFSFQNFSKISLQRVMGSVVKCPFAKEQTKIKMAISPPTHNPHT